MPTIGNVMFCPVQCATIVLLFDGDPGWKAINTNNLYFLPVRGHFHQVCENKIVNADVFWYGYIGSFNNSGT